MSRINGSQHPQHPQSTRETTFSSRLLKQKVSLGCAMIFALVCLLLCQGCQRAETVQEFNQRGIAAVNKVLVNPENPIRKRIESAHVTVTAKSARISSWTVQTIDGSSNAGHDGSNIGDVDMVITVFWDGLIQQDGYTEIELLYDYQNKKVKETQYLRSNAVINLENIDWASVGFEIGTYLGAALL